MIEACNLDHITIIKHSSKNQNSKVISPLAEILNPHNFLHCYKDIQNLLKLYQLEQDSDVYNLFFATSNPYELILLGDYLFSIIDR
jgi:hypothetical protein